MITQRIKPSIPLPSIVKHACMIATIAAAATSGFHVERCLTRASFSGFSFMVSDFLSLQAARRQGNTCTRFAKQIECRCDEWLLNDLRNLACLPILQDDLQFAIRHPLFL